MLVCPRLGIEADALGVAEELVDVLRTARRNKAEPRISSEHACYMIIWHEKQEDSAPAFMCSLGLGYLGSCRIFFVSAVPTLTP